MTGCDSLKFRSLNRKKDIRWENHCSSLAISPNFNKMIVLTPPRSDFVNDSKSLLLDGRLLRLLRSIELETKFQVTFPYVS